MSSVSPEYICDYNGKPHITTSTTFLHWGKKKKVHFADESNWLAISLSLTQPMNFFT